MSIDSTGTEQRFYAKTLALFFFHFNQRDGVVVVAVNERWPADASPLLNTHPSRPRFAHVSHKATKDFDKKSVS